MRRMLTATLLVFVSLAAGQERTPSAPEAEVYVISPQHRATVRSPFTVRFGLKGDKVLHFGKGQTETTLTLPPGRHTLQLVLADHNHIPHDPPLISAKITVMVRGPDD